MSLVTPLNRVLGLGSAKEGVEHWWLQRLTAVALIPLGLWLALALMGLDDFSYATVVAWIRSPVNSVLLMLAVVTAIYHSQLGVQIVIEDYVHVPAMKIGGLILSSFVHVALAVAGIYSIARVAFGAAA